MFTGPTRSAKAAPQRAVGGQAGRRNAIAALYSRESGRLLAGVAAELAAGRGLAEDACQTAWLALLVRDDVAVDARGVAWLRAVALTAGARAARGRDLAAQPLVDRGRPGGGGGRPGAANPRARGAARAPDAADGVAGTSTAAPDAPGPRVQLRGDRCTDGRQLSDGPASVTPRPRAAARKPPTSA